MKKTLYDYAEIIKKLPLRDKYTKEELLIEDLLVDRENNIEIYYAPHNDYINTRAKLMIVGITPGFIQMNTAIATARRELENNTNIEDIQYKCKIAGRFSGSLRKNLISMLDEIKLNEIFNLDSCSELFGKKDYLMHTVSLIPYPVFVKKQNYTGHSPKLLKSDFLMKYIYENFINEIRQLDNFENILLIPLGKAVEEVLYRLKDENLIKEDQILRGFPHPSGANVNRLNQLEENKEQMINFLKKRTVS